MEYERERKKEWFSLPPQGGKRVICSPTGKTSRLGKFLLPKPEVSSAVPTLPPDWTGVPTGRPEFSPDWIPMHKIGLAQTDTRVSTPDWIMRAGTSSVATGIALYISIRHIPENFGGCRLIPLVIRHRRFPHWFRRTPSEYSFIERTKLLQSSELWLRWNQFCWKDNKE
jgi:hypothetical protein